MMNSFIWDVQATLAKERAQKKYPDQPERARRMADKQLGIYNGPYDLEPLTLWQKIKKLFE